MFDVIHRESHHSQCVRVSDTRVARQIQGSDHTAAWIENGRRITAEDSVRFEEMLGAANFNSATLRQGRADGICSGRRLVPRNAWPQGHACRSSCELGAAERVENHSLSVAQDDDAVCIASIRVQRFDLGATKTMQLLIATTNITGLARAHGLDAGSRSGVQPHPETSLP